MLGAVGAHEALEEVLDLLAVCHFDGRLDLFVEREEAGQQLGVVRRLADAERMQQVEGALARDPGLALGQVGRVLTLRWRAERDGE